jgi:hypothetical protein
MRTRNLGKRHEYNWVYMYVMHVDGGMRWAADVILAVVRSRGVKD